MIDDGKHFGWLWVALEAFQQSIEILVLVSRIGAGYH